MDFFFLLVEKKGGEVIFQSLLKDQGAGPFLSPSTRFVAVSYYSSLAASALTILMRKTALGAP